MNFDELEQMLLAPAPADRVVAQARQLLEGVVSGRHPLRAVRHPLGFLCLPALREPDRGVCIHLFDPADPAGPRADPYHSHSWDLLSHVLYGVVTNEPVEVVDDHERPTHRIYEVIIPAASTWSSPRSGVSAAAPGPCGQCSRGRPTPCRQDGSTRPRPFGGPPPPWCSGAPGQGGHDFSLGPLDGRTSRTVRTRCDVK